MGADSLWVWIPLLKPSAPAELANSSIMIWLKFWWHFSLSVRYSSSGRGRSIRRSQRPSQKSADTISDSINSYSFTDPDRCELIIWSRFHQKVPRSWSVWLDWAKFRHYGKFLLIFGKSLEGFLIFVKNFNLPW